MPYVDMLFWNTGMFEATLEGISERPVAECTAVQVADALTRPFEGLRKTHDPSCNRDRI
jgi:hypothetical protein